MCCDNLKNKLGGTDNCYKNNSSVAKGTQRRRFEVERRAEHSGCCSITIDCLQLMGNEKRCDNVISICHKDENGKELTNHYFVEFKDNKSSSHPFKQINATIDHFKKKNIPLHHKGVYGIVLTTTGVHNSLTLKKEVWVREFIKEYGTTPIVTHQQHKMQF